MIDPRLQKFLDVGKIFLNGVSSIPEALIEGQTCQQNLMEIIELQAELNLSFTKAERDLSCFMSEKRDLAYKVFKDKGYSPTAQNIEDHVIRVFRTEYEDLKREFDYAKCNYEVSDYVRWAYISRKDLIIKMIDAWTCKTETEGCIMNNKLFARKLLAKLEAM